MSGPEAPTGASDPPQPRGHEAISAVMGGLESRTPAGSTAGNRADGRGRGGRRRKRRDESVMVPDADFTSYYGRPIVKASPWQADIPAYLFLGGLAAGSSLLGAGADLTDRPALRRVGRIGAAGAITVSFAALVHDLGRPSRFLNMLRVVKVTSPMSVGTWILTVYGPLTAIAAADELSGPLPAPLRKLTSVVARPAGVGSALFAPLVASYTAVLLSDTSLPAWSASRRQLPFVFAGSAAAAAGGLGVLAAPAEQSGPARRLAVGGALVELAAEHRMESAMGLPAQTLHEGVAGRLMRASKALTVTGAAAALLAKRSRIAATVSGVALLAGSACTRFGIFEAGQASARDPRYTVVPQRKRLDARRAHPPGTAGATGGSGTASPSE